MAIKQHQVNRICDTLKAAGKKPTLAAVREEAGTGSFSTIGPMIKVWQDQQQTEENTAEKQLENLRSQLEIMGYMLTATKAATEKARAENEELRAAVMPLMATYVKDGKPKARPHYDPADAVEAWTKAAKVFGWMTPG